MPINALAAPVAPVALAVFQRWLGKPAESPAASSADERKMTGNKKVRSGGLFSEFTGAS